MVRLRHILHTAIWALAMHIIGATSSTSVHRHDSSSKGIGTYNSEFTITDRPADFVKRRLDFDA
jgi:hypothetical protein